MKKQVELKQEVFHDELGSKEQVEASLTEGWNWTCPLLALVWNLKENQIDTDTIL